MGEIESALVCLRTVCSLFESDLLVKLCMRFGRGLWSQSSRREYRQQSVLACFELRRSATHLELVDPPPRMPELAMLGRDSAEPPPRGKEEGLLLRVGSLSSPRRPYSSSPPSSSS